MNELQEFEDPRRSTNPAHVETNQITRLRKVLPAKKLQKKEQS